VSLGFSCRSFYGFKANEILENNPFLDLEVDPKWLGVVKHHTFPVIIQHAPLEMICAFQELVKSAHKIVYARRFQNLSMEHLKIGVSVNRAKYFISVVMKTRI
jgi:predicted DNA-binding helix-hairpin-helix protein